MQWIRDVVKADKNNWQCTCSTTWDFLAHLYLLAYSKIVMFFLDFFCYHRVSDSSLVVLSPLCFFSAPCSISFVVVSIVVSACYFIFLLAVIKTNRRNTFICILLYFLTTSFVLNSFQLRRTNRSRDRTINCSFRVILSDSIPLNF